MTTGLAFVPACNNGGGTATTDAETGGESTTTDATTTTESTGVGESTSNDTTTTDDTTTDVDSSESSSSESGDPQCGGANTCGALPPIGWFGPAIYARVDAGEAPPACPPEVSNVGPTVLEGFVDPGPAVCTCECSLSRPQTCNSNMVVSTEPDCSQVCSQYGYYNYNYCYEYSGSYPVTESCQNVSVGGFVRFTSNEDYYYYGGGNPTCEETESEMIPPFQWAAQIATCRIPDSALACDEGVCVPPPPDGFEAKWCMYQQGDLECPAGPYPVKTLFWSGVEDTRSCSNCACGTAAQTCEEAELMVFGGPDCAGEPVANIPATNVCTSATGASVAGNFGAQGACPVTTDSEPQGSIAATGPFTFCCSE